MIDRFEQAATSVGLEEGAERLGRTPYESSSSPASSSAR
jgi:hypothetical protein